ncbi:hypothetical protein BCR39DRAFT_582802 [Naematelia encephala]|uniref:Uncharacterized protein n=1 Tax=Naematelia encephala TaxID=71784 RepID=A0A1Y2AM27_9TREE|nr:hypothetical protein BCR39DRAFT_582802 [Naematelia encephala]
MSASSTNPSSCLNPPSQDTTHPAHTQYRAQSGNQPEETYNVDWDKILKMASSLPPTENSSVSSQLVQDPAFSTGYMQNPLSSNEAADTYGYQYPLQPVGLQGEDWNLQGQTNSAGQPSIFLSPNRTTQSGESDPHAASQYQSMRDFHHSQSDLTNPAGNIESSSPLSCPESRLGLGNAPHAWSHQASMQAVRQGDDTNFARPFNFPQGGWYASTSAGVPDSLTAFAASTVARSSDDHVAAPGLTRSSHRHRGRPRGPNDSYSREISLKCVGEGPKCLVPKSTKVVVPNVHRQKVTDNVLTTLCLWCMEGRATLANSKPLRKGTQLRTGVGAEWEDTETDKSVGILCTCERPGTSFRGRTHLTMKTVRVDDTEEETNREGKVPREKCREGEVTRKKIEIKEQQSTSTTVFQYMAE